MHRPVPKGDQTTEQHRRGSSSGQDSSEDTNIYFLDREDGGLEREVKEAIYVELE